MPERAGWRQRLGLYKKTSSGLVSDTASNSEAPFSDAAAGDPAALWRARAVRYMLIYVALTAALLAMRYATQDTYPHLRELRAQISDLQTQRDTLDLQVQQLTTGPRILDWARAHDMVPYAQAAKQSASFAATPPPAVDTGPTFKVDTQWH